MVATPLGSTHWTLKPGATKNFQKGGGLKKSGIINKVNKGIEMKATKKLSKINNHLYKHVKVNYFHLHEITILG